MTGLATPGELPITAVLILVTAIVAVVALLIVQVRVGLRFQDGGPVTPAIAAVAAVAASASIVCATVGSPMAILATIATVMLFTNALRQPGDLATDRA